MDVKLKTDQGTAMVQGKTSVPFKTFVQLILQRKVLTLFKRWGDEPVIVDGELLTSLASAPGDTQENRSHLVLVTLGVGVLVGVFAFAVIQIALVPFGIEMNQTYLLIIAGTLLGLAILTVLLSRVQRKSKGEKLADTMERVANLLSK